MSKIFLGDVQFLDEDSRYSSTIFFPDRTSVNLIIASDIGLNGRNEFGKSLSVENVAGSISSAAGGIARAVRGGADTTLNIFSGRTVVPIWETQAIWEGNGKPVFDLEVILVCLKSRNEKGEIDEANSVLSRIKKLQRLVYPDIIETDIGDVFTPPLGYTRTNDDNGKVKLKIGKWFYATKLVCNQCSFRLSQQVNINGEPIFATGVIELTPYRNISYKEYLSYFTNNRP
jgi:hypothetical protein